MAVPNTDTFNLLEVKSEVEKGGSTVNSLQDAFDNAIAGGFDPTYNNDSYAPSNSLLRFRNYQNYLVTATIQFNYANRTLPNTNVTYSLSITLDKPLSENVTFYINIQNSNGLGGFRRIGKEIVAGNTSVTQVLGESGCTLNSFVATVYIDDITTGTLSKSQINYGDTSDSITIPAI